MPHGSPRLFIKSIVVLSALAAVHGLPKRATRSGAEGALEPPTRDLETRSKLDGASMKPLDTMCCHRDFVGNDAEITMRFTISGKFWDHQRLVFQEVSPSAPLSAPCYTAGLNVIQKPNVDTNIVLDAAGRYDLFTRIHGNEASDLRCRKLKRFGTTITLKRRQICVAFRRANRKWSAKGVYQKYGLGANNCQTWMTGFRDELLRQRKLYARGDAGLAQPLLLFESGGSDGE